MLKRWHQELTTALLNNVRAYPESYPVRKIKDTYRRINRWTAPPDNGDFMSTASFMATEEVVSLIQLVERVRNNNQGSPTVDNVGDSNDRHASAGNNGRHPEWVPQEVVENLLPPRAGETRREPSEARAARRWEEPRSQAEADFRPTDQARKVSWADEASPPAWGKVTTLSLFNFKTDKRPLLYSKA